MQTPSISPPTSLVPALREFAIDGLQATFEETETEFRPCCVITYGKIKEEGSIKLHEVVVKTFRVGGGTTDVKAAQASDRTYREISAWVALAKAPIRCENINCFLGVASFNLERGVAVPDVPSIVTNFVKFGSLEYTQGAPFSVRMDVIQQLANGLRHMHSMTLVHGDVKPDNFRVNGDGSVKIIDLGLSRYQASSRTGLTTIIEPSYRFIAPELIIQYAKDVSMSVTTATDVYAFSMTALQILDGRGTEKSTPFNDCGDSAYAVQSAVLRNDWPKRSNYSGVEPQAWRVISRCWTNSGSGRPSMKEIVEDLLALYSC